MAAVTETMSLGEMLGEIAAMVMRADSLAFGVDERGRLLDVEPESDETLALGALVAAEIVRMARDLKAKIDSQLLERIEGAENKRIIAEGHTFTVRWSKARRAWDNDALRSAVARTVLADSDGVARAGPDVWEQVNAAFNLAGGNARTTWLKAHGIDPDDFAGEVDDAKATLDVQGGDV